MTQSPKRLALIDGDIVAYSVGFKAEGDPVSHALHSAKVMCENIQSDANCDEYQVFLTGANNFRIKTATIQPYKGNRTQPKPTHLPAIREYLAQHKGAILTDGVEADDALGITQLNPPENTNTVICTIDKDLDLIQGEHYCWRGKRKGTYFIDEDESNLNFYRQLFKGDAGDHIPGMYKYCKLKATEKLMQPLAHLTTDKDRYEYVASVYASGVVKNGPQYNMTIDEFLTEIGQLLWIHRKPNDIWMPPT